MVFYQFKQAGNEEYQSLKKWNSVVGIVAAGSQWNSSQPGTVPKFHFTIIANFHYHSACIFRYDSENHCVRNFLFLVFFIQTTSFLVFLISTLTVIILV